MNRLITSIGLASLVLLQACGEAHTPSADADAADNADGGEYDAGPAIDAGPPVDAGEGDASHDAGAPDAGREPCTSPGATRTGSCGACGTAAQTCTGGFWEDTSACLGEGECSAGSVETRRTDRCAEETRVCLDACTWTAWEETAPEGECAVGETRRDPTGCTAGARTQHCTDSCAWGAASACTDECGGTARTTPAWAAEVCVPAGTFQYGSSATAGLTVTMSAFYIDAYPVTNRRYMTCVSAGACTQPEILRELDVDMYSDPARIDFPVGGVSWAQASAFCAWDGGRVLPSEAQWEMAYRGPSPRTVAWPWGDASPCSFTELGNCDGRSGLIADAYDALPTTRSRYGTYMQYGGGIEWTRTWFSLVHVHDRTDTSDPEGPPSGVNGHTLRGVQRGYPETLDERLDRADAADAVATIRCMHLAPGL